MHTESTCQHCGKPFPKTRSDRIFCGPACGTLASIRRLEERRSQEGMCIRCGSPGTSGPRGGRPYCDSCRAHRRVVYNRQHKRMNRPFRVRTAALAVYGGACEDCGFSHPATLQFHHLAGEDGPLKDREGSAKLLGSIMRHGRHPGIVLLCANCHAIRHKGHLYLTTSE